LLYSSTRISIKALISAFDFRLDFQGTVCCDGHNLAGSLNKVKEKIAGSLNFIDCFSARVLKSDLNIFVSRAIFRAMAKKGKTEEMMLNVKQVSQRISAGESSVRLWASQGRFPGAQLRETPMGSYWEIPESSLIGFENQGRGRPPKPKEEGKKATVSAKRARTTRNN
jgi:hypothetical protein